MNQPESPVVCYTAALHNPTIDPYLEAQGFTHGLVIFAVPSLGVQFRCRAEGELVDLEFGAFFSLLKFIKTNLTEVQIKSARVLSSNAEFVFAFSGTSRHLDMQSERAMLLSEYCRQLTLSVGLVEPLKNKALVSPVDLPSLPRADSLNLNSIANEFNKAGFKPMQKGIKL